LDIGVAFVEHVRVRRWLVASALNPAKGASGRGASATVTGDVLRYR
jgi:hypothetical protein